MLRVHFSVQHTYIDFVDVLQQCIIQLPLLYSALCCILYFLGNEDIGAFYLHFVLNDKYLLTECFVSCGNRTTCLNVGDAILAGMIVDRFA